MSGLYTDSFLRYGSTKPKAEFVLLLRDNTPFPPFAYSLLNEAFAYSL